MTQVVRTMPGGVEHEESISHRLGDFFAAIRLLPDAEADPASFRIAFQRRLNAGRFWKDLMVNLLQELEARGQIRRSNWSRKARRNQLPRPRSDWAVWLPA